MKQKNNLTGILLHKYEGRQLSKAHIFRQFDLQIENDRVVRFTCSQAMTRLIDNHNEGDRITVRYYFGKENSLFCDHARLNTKCLNCESELINNVCHVCEPQF